MSHRTDGIDHELKVWPPYYQDVQDNRKAFEIRRNDRDFKVGDICLMREYRPATHGFPGSFTGRSVRREIIYVLPDGEFGVLHGFVVLGIRPVDTDDQIQQRAPFANASNDTRAML